MASCCSNIRGDGARPDDVFIHASERIRLSHASRPGGCRVVQLRVGRRRRRRASVLKPYQRSIFPSRSELRDASPRRSLFYESRSPRRDARLVKNMRASQGFDGITPPAFVTTPPPGTTWSNPRPFTRKYIRRRDESTAPRTLSRRPSRGNWRE